LPPLPSQHSEHGGNVKGIVFNLLEEVVRGDLGERAWDDLLESAGDDGIYTSLGNYPDGRLIALVMAASRALNQKPDQIVRWFARKSLPLLAGKYPHFFAPHRSTRPFLLTLNDIIHPEVRKLYPGADVPEFDFETSDPQVLVMGYRSARKLCSFAEGLIEGAAAHYGEIASIHQSQCMHRGDPKCVLHVSLTPGAAQ
jgi:hypothetical protein